MLPSRAARPAIVHGPSVPARQAHATDGHQEIVDIYLGRSRQINGVVRGTCAATEFWWSILRRHEPCRLRPGRRFPRQLCAAAACLPARNVLIQRKVSTTDLCRMVPIPRFRRRFLRIGGLRWRCLCRGSHIDLSAVWRVRDRLVVLGERRKGRTRLMRTSDDRTCTVLAPCATGAGKADAARVDPLYVRTYRTPLAAGQPYVRKRRPPTA